MLSQLKWARFATTFLLVLALLCGSVWAKKPPKDPPPPPPPPPELGITYELTLIYGQMLYSVGMNSAGHLVGDQHYDGDVQAAMYYSPESGVIDLNTLLPPDSGMWLHEATDINDKEQIAGYGRVDGVLHAFRLTPEHVVYGVTVPVELNDLGLLHPDDMRTLATGINEAGVVCGEGWDVNQTYFSWYYTDATGMQPLAGSNTMAVTINDAGLIVGETETTPNAAWLMLPGQEPEFFYSEDGNSMDPEFMNNSGVFVGGARFTVPGHGHNTSLEERAFMHAGSQLIDLGAGNDSVAFGINDAGDAVGALDDDVGYRVAGFIYKADTATLYNLDDLITGSSADLAVWFDIDSEVVPYRINDAGQISGYIINNWGILDEYRGTVGFILNPVEN